MRPHQLPVEGQQPIPYRSVAEMRIANELLSKEGQWDEAKKGFRTKECQLQERSRHFNQLHQVLRYTPADAYEKQGSDTSFRYPLCLQDMLKTKPATNSGMEDPSGPQIEQRRVIAAQNRMRQEKNQSKQLREVEGVLRRAASETLATSVNQEDEASKAYPNQRQVGPPLDVSAAQHNTPMDCSALGRAGASPSPAGVRSSSSLNTTHGSRKGEYSSVLVQMKRTKASAERAAREFTAVRTILEMPATAQLKETITKMFAHPEAAEELSQLEHNRREREFEEERLANIRYQDSVLQEERLVIERDMQQLRGGATRR